MNKILLTAIILVFILLGSYGINVDLPSSSRIATETQQIKLAVKFGSGDLNPQNFSHPVFFADMLLFFYGITFLFGKALGIFKTVLDFERLWFVAPALFYVIARCITLVLAVCGILVLYLTGKRLFNKNVSLLACFFMAFSPVFVKWAHYATPDIPMFFFSLSSFYFIVRILQRGLFRDYILAGVLCGLAIGTKYNAGLLIIPILIAHFFSPEGHRSLAKLFDRKLIPLFLCIVSSFFLTNPFTFLHYKAFLGGTGSVPDGSLTDLYNEVVANKKFGFPSYKIDKIGWLYILTDTFPFGIGMPLTILVVIGFFYSLYRHKKEDWLLLSLIFASYLIIGSWGVIKPRYFINIFPLIFLLSARFLLEIISKIKFMEKFKAFTIGLASISLIIIPFSNIIKFDIVVSKKPVNMQAKEWIEKNIPPGSSIATLVGIPLVPNEDSIKRQLQEIEEKKSGAGLRLKNLLKYLDSFKATYNVIELPYPWREDYDDSKFDFYGCIKKGVRFFILTPETEEYFAEPEKYHIQISYFNLVRQNCKLIKEFKSPCVKVEPGFLANEEYVKIYRYD